jgi:hypothetical protein
MPTIVFSVAWFASAIVLHIVWWRAGRPRRMTATLLKYLLAMLPAGWVVGAWVVGAIWPGLSGRVFTDFWDVCLYAQFHLACSLAYTCIHQAIQEDSPALLTMTFVSVSGREGCTRDDVLAALDDDLMIRPRLRDFVTAEMIELVDGRYQLTEGGRKFRRVFEAIRIVFRLPRGG